MTPDTQTLAQANASSYNGDTPNGYSRLAELSSPDISTFKHNQENHYIVAHKGTDVHSNSLTNDLKSDFNILIGNTNHDKLHHKRADLTENIYKKIKETNPESEIHLTGHSLGGSTSQASLIKSQFVRDNTTSHNTFNAGTSPLQSKPADTNHENYKQIADISTHHRVKGDSISSSIHDSMIGDIKQYDSKPLTISQHVLNYVKPLAEQSQLGKLAHFTASKIAQTLSSHSLNNFVNKNDKIKSINPLKKIVNAFKIF
jgi:hypothetical protein